MAKRHEPNFLTCPGVPELGSGKSGGDAQGAVRGKLFASPPKSEPEKPKAPEAPKPKPEVPDESRPVSPFVSRPGVVSKHEEILDPGQAESLRGTLPRSAPPEKKAAPSLPKRKHHWVLWTLLGLLVVTLVLVGPAAYALTRAATSAYAAKTAAVQASDAVQRKDFGGALTGIEAAKADIISARESLRGVGFWRNIPYVGTQVRALERAADASKKTLDGVESLLKVAADIMAIASRASSAASADLGVPSDGSFASLGPDEKRAILARIDRALPDMRAAQVDVDIALETWNAIPEDSLAVPIRNALRPIAETLPKLKRTLDEVVPLLDAVLPLAGYPSPSNYLVLLENSDELRATGGFIGTVGKLEVDGGNITQFSFDDVYNIDGPAMTSSAWKDPAPAFIRERMNVPALYLRDANYTPDFPTSAERVIDMYLRESAVAGKHPATPTGVIALTPPIFADLLRVTGPITIDKYTFTADSYFDILEYQVEIGFLEKGIPRNERKDLVSKLGNELFARLMRLPASKWPDLFDVATQALREKQALIYARDPGFLSRLDALGWTGRTIPTNGDYLWIVDTNLAALKTDGVMTKSASYDVDARDPSNVIATLTLRYTNNAPGFKEYRYTRYRDYVRVYVPEGSEFISVQGAMADDVLRTNGIFKPGRVDVMNELGKRVFGAFWSIEPGETRELTFKYKLPASLTEKLNAGAYALDWQKQPGNDTATLDLDVMLPKTLKSAVPPEDSSEWGDARYRVEASSETDRRFGVTF